MHPYFELDGITIYHGDFREVAPQLSAFDLVIADPPYGETNLSWDRWIPDFPKHMLPLVSPRGSFWCFGSFKVFFEHAAEFAGWREAQEVVWEKHNGSAIHNDRFRRVHELAIQFYSRSTRWASVYKQPLYTYDAKRRRVTRSRKPAHFHGIGPSHYEVEEGGPRLMRSVIYARSEHGRGLNPTQKPEPVVSPLIQYSCPPDGVLLDPCMGSGSFLMAAKKLGRHAVGIEIRESQCEQAARWLSQKVAVLNGGEP